MQGYENMTDASPPKNTNHGIYSIAFARAFRALFRPISHSLNAMGISPNAVTISSLLLACVTAYFIAIDRLWIVVPLGMLMGFSDIVDGQLAKEFGLESKFGGILDSTIDRYCEFVIFFGFALRYYFLGRPLWITGCAVAFCGSVMVSYIKARAEADGFSCKVGRLQRPERLTIIGIGCIFLSAGVDIMIVFLAIATQLTALQRLLHVSKQADKSNRSQKH